MRRDHIEIKKLGINGEGIGYIRKKICFIPHALPGEIVDVEITKETPKYYMGKVINYVKTSPYRKDSFCLEYQSCLGCSLTSLNYKKQLSFKKDLLKDAFKKHTDFSIETLPIQDVVPSLSLEQYKKVVSLPVTEFNRKIRFGIYQRETKYLTLMSRCHVQDELINKVLVKMENIFHKHHVRAYNEHFKKGLRFVEVKNIDNALQILFVTGNDGLNENVTKEISRIPEVKSLFLTINTTRHQDFKLQGYKRIYGETKLPFSCFEKQYDYSMKSHFPINPSMEKQILQTVINDIEPTDFVLSLYCGVGLLELSLDQKIIGIDDKKYHIQDALDNAKKQQRENVRFICQNIDDAVVSQCKKKYFDTMIVRHDHLSLKVKESFRLSKIKNIIYISDHPSSIAKDLQDLKDDYSIETIIPFDYYPHTPKMEVLVKMKKR